jgi:ethanolamine ammonia-lyase small subunit
MSDPWLALRASTRARIGLGRTGDALPVKDVLAFQLAHARARDAVHTPLDTAVMTQAIAPLPSVTVHSQAPDRQTYLRRPDLGRRLDPACHGLLTGTHDVVFVVADGLSPAGVQHHAPALLAACFDRLPNRSVAPVVIATQARVALGDEIGALLQAELCAVLIGERPGLSVANSLGVYLTWQPRIGRRDSERNCISNIHPDGLSCDAAADMLVWLMTEARTRKLTGVELKDNRTTAMTQARDTAAQLSPARLPAPHPLE